MQYIEVYIVNAFAILLIGVMTLVSKKRIFIPSYEMKDIRLLNLITVISCIIEPMTYYFDSKAGGFAWFVVNILNGYQYLAYAFISFLWFVFLHKHMFGNMTKKQILISTIPGLISFILIFVNFFEPFIYSVDINNHYVRLWGYFLTLDICVLYLIASFAHYLFALKKNGGLILFPAWVFILPIIVVSFIGTFVKNISVNLAGISIGLAGVVASLQNETIYRDRLTGIFNRGYIDIYLHRFMKRKCFGIMIDLNNFKIINDTYGHKIGDEALVNFSNALRVTLGNHGACLRYAGDEFIVFINTSNSNGVLNFLNCLNENLCKSKILNSYEYTLSYSYGYGFFDAKTTDFDTFLNEIDQNMYKNKRKYHDCK